MSQSSPLETPRKHCIAIAGNGFSGALTLVNLVRQTTLPLRLLLIGEGTPGLGVAYATADSRHLLNVPAARMGAFPDDTGGFFQWLENAPTAKEIMARDYPGLTLSPTAFLPRSLYGRYVAHLLEAARAEAQSKSVDVEYIAGTARDAESLTDASGDTGMRVEVHRDGRKEWLEADSLVLATGNLPPRQFPYEAGLFRANARYLNNIWQPGEASLFAGDDLRHLSREDCIVIIGTGLTMVDAVLTLKGNGFPGRVVAISRHGKLPQAHAPFAPYAAWEWVTHPGQAPRTARSLLTGLRTEMKRAQAEGADWRALIDSLRPATVALWRQLPVEEKRRFAEKLLPWWNIHRHRMPPDSAQRLEQWRKNGELEIMPGRIYYIDDSGDRLTLWVRRRGEGEMRTIRAVCAMNCTGPEADIARCRDPLLRNLHDRRLITVGPLRMGIEIDPAERAARGASGGAIFAIGPLLLGEELETTAVPELRQQAAHLAARLLGRAEDWHHNHARVSDREFKSLPRWMAQAI